MLSTYAAIACIVAGLVALFTEGARLERKIQQLQAEKEECCGPDNK